MTERNFLYKCTFCLNKNINVKILNKNTFNRHRTRIQEFSERDDENIYIEENIYLDIEENIYLDMEENIHLDAEKNIYLNMEENIYLDTEENIHLNTKENIHLDIEEEQIEKNIDDDSDTESFNFNEEDIEYYSDYNNDDNNNNDNNDNNSNGDDNNDKESDNDESDDSNDDKSDDDESNDNKSDDDDESDDDKSDDDKSDDDENMQIDDETNIPNKKIIEGLKLLYLKSLYNFTEFAYDDIMKIFITNNLSLYKIKKYLKDTTGLVSVFYDICENSCIYYTGQYETYQNCPICESTRLDIRGKAKKIMPYLSIKDRLQIQFNDVNRAKELLYHHEYIINKHNDNDDLDDIFDGKIYKELVEENLFNNKRDIAFTASCDGYQIFKQKTDDC